MALMFVEVANRILASCRQWHIAVVSYSFNKILAK
jgi:hypothetical protein